MNGSLQFTLSGASPGTVYIASQIFKVGGSESYLLYNIQDLSACTTDSMGDLTLAVVQDGLAGDFFLADPQANQTGFIGGFSVPK